MENNDNNEVIPYFGILSGVACAFGVWALVVFVSGLASVEFSVSEMGRQYLVATGNSQNYATMVDFYSQIKGFEYIIVGAFFLAIPTFIKFFGAKEKIRS